MVPNSKQQRVADTLRTFPFLREMSSRAQEGTLFSFRPPQSLSFVRSYLVLRGSRFRISIGSRHTISRDDIVIGAPGAALFPVFLCGAACRWRRRQLPGRDKWSGG